MILATAQHKDATTRSFATLQWIQNLFCHNYHAIFIAFYVAPCILLWLRQDVTAEYRFTDQIVSIVSFFLFAIFDYCFDLFDVVCALSSFWFPIELPYSDCFSLSYPWSKVLQLFSTCFWFSYFVFSLWYWASEECRYDSEVLNLFTAVRPDLSITFESAATFLISYSFSALRQNLLS